MDDFINCSVCNDFLLEGNAYGYITKDMSGEIQLYYGHKECLEAMMNRKRLVIHPAAFNPSDPLYIGYVGK